MIDNNCKFGIINLLDRDLDEGGPHGELRALIYESLADLDWENIEKEQFGFVKTVGDTISETDPDERDGILKNTVLPAIDSWVKGSVRGPSPFLSHKRKSKTVVMGLATRRFLRDSVIKKALGLELASRAPSMAPEDPGADLLFSTVQHVSTNETIIRAIRKEGNLNTSTGRLVKEMVDILLQHSQDKRGTVISLIEGEFRRAIFLEEKGKHKSSDNAKEVSFDKTKQFIDELLIELTHRIPTGQEKDTGGDNSSKVASTGHDVADQIQRTVSGKKHNDKAA